MWLRSVGLLACLAPLTACTALPSSGPDARAIQVQAASYQPAGAGRQALPFSLVDLSADVITALNSADNDSFASSIGTAKPAAPVLGLGIGDIVQVTIFEAQSGGLFVPQTGSASPGNYVTLPPQAIDRSGRIAVPYAGAVTAAGRTVRQVQRDIETRLGSRALEPQAVINVVSQKSTQVSVLGDVSSAGTFPIDAGGSRILDMLSKAAGFKSPGYDLSVTLQRGTRSASLPFTSLVSNPDDNIYVQPGDVLYVSRQPRTFMAFGASGQNGAIDFPKERISLAEAIGLAKGLADGQADPRQVFLYRIEKREALSHAGISLAAYPVQQTQIPVVFRANLRDPAGLFLAQSFQIRDKDIVYISNADAVQFAKFLGLLQTASTITAQTRLTVQ